jgi:hypothetical protein
MSELHSARTDTDSGTTSETNTATRIEREPAPDGGDRRYQDTRTAERQDYGQDDDATIEARLDEAGLPTRTESRAATWGPDATGDEDDDFGDEYDGDLEALLAEPDDGLPSRAESRASTWGPDATGEDDEPDLGPESDDAAIEASLDEADLPTRAESRAATWGPDATSDADDRQLAGEYDGDLSAAAAGPDRSPAQQDSAGTRPIATENADADTSQSTSVNGEQAAEARSGTGPLTDTAEDASAIHAGDQAVDTGSELTESGDSEASAERDDHQRDQDGRGKPNLRFGVAQADRTVGDLTATGIGLKPTGELLLDMESETESPLERLRHHLYKDAGDVTDVLKEQGDTAISLFESPPTGTHSEVPGGHPDTSRPAHHPIEGGHLALAGFVVGVLGFEVFRRVKNKVEAWRGDDHGRDRPAGSDTEGNADRQPWRI